jgi:hypothetical protein
MIFNPLLSFLHSIFLKIEDTIMLNMEIPAGA